MFNVTTTADGRSRALQPRELYRTQQYATAVYRSELATRLIALGYDIERGPAASPKFAGTSPSTSTPRVRDGSKFKHSLDQEARRGAAAAQIAAHKTREAKSHASHEEMRHRHQALATSFGEQPAQVVRSARQRGDRPSREVVPPSEDRAADAALRAAVIYARDRNLERHAVPHERDYLRDALSRSMGQATAAEVHAEFTRKNGGYG